MFDAFTFAFERTDAGWVWAYGYPSSGATSTFIVECAPSTWEGLGLSAGAARRCGHIGRLGEYAERASGEGLVLIATVNNGGGGQRVAPPGGLEPRLGTNPLCIGVPTESEPIVLDFGTSVAAEGKVRVYYFNGKRPVPEGWLLDHQGRPTTDPSVLYEPPTPKGLPGGER